MHGAAEQVCVRNSAHKFPWEGVNITWRIWANSCQMWGPLYGGTGHWWVPRSPAWHQRRVSSYHRRNGSPKQSTFQDLACKTGQSPCFWTKPPRLALLPAASCHAQLRGPCILPVLWFWVDTWRCSRCPAASHGMTECRWTLGHRRAAPRRQGPQGG